MPTRATTGNAGCWPRATNGHAAVLSPAMNSRRRIRDLPRWIGAAYRGWGRVSGLDPLFFARREAAHGTTLGVKLPSRS
jgi:hypothetical protein